MALRIHRKRVKGPLLVITQTTAGKWWLSLLTPAKNQSASWTTMAAAIHCGSPLAAAKMTMVTQ